MDKVVSNLQQWAVRFLQNKDLILKKIVEIKEEEGILSIKYKDKDQEIFITPELDSFDLEKVKDGHKGIVTISNMQNVDFTVKNWNKLIQNKNLVMYFVNPFSKTEKRWIIFPFTHDRVAEGKKIKDGLLSLYSNVEPVTYEEFQKIVS